MWNRCSRECICSKGHICKHTYAHTHAHKDACTQTHIQTHMHIYPTTQKLKCAHTHTHKDIHTNTQSQHLHTRTHEQTKSVWDNQEIFFRAGFQLLRGNSLLNSIWPPEPLLHSAKNFLSSLVKLGHRF